MKNIKIYMILICLGVSANQFAQTEIRDNTLNGLRAAQLIEVTAVAGERTALALLFDRLHTQEEEYQLKISVASITTSTPIYAGLTRISLSNRNLIRDLERQVRRIKRIPRFLRHGIKDIESRLEREKEYHDKIDDNIALSLAQVATAGGAGYNYTFWLKKFQQMQDNRSNLQEIQYHLDNSGTINKIFKE